MNPSPQKGGFIKLHRKFFSHPLWMETRALSRAEAFLDLLQLAAFIPHKIIVKGVLCELLPGQLFGSERYLADRWQWSNTKVRAFLDLLRADEMLTLGKQQGITLITLRNYVAYANSGLEETAAKQQPDSTAAAPGQRTEEGEEREEGQSVSLPETSPQGPPSPPEIPTLAAVQDYYRAQPEPAPPHVAAAFHDTQQAHGWATRHGQPIVDWRAAARRYLSRWHDLERAKKSPAATRSTARRRHHNGYHEDLSLP